MNITVLLDAFTAAAKAVIVFVGIIQEAVACAVVPTLLAGLAIWLSAETLLVGNTDVPWLWRNWQKLAVAGWLLQRCLFLLLTNPSIEGFLSFILQVGRSSTSTLRFCNCLVYTLQARTAARTYHANRRTARNPAPPRQMVGDTAHDTESASSSRIASEDISTGQMQVEQTSAAAGPSTMQQIPSVPEPLDTATVSSPNADTTPLAARAAALPVPDTPPPAAAQAAGAEDDALLPRWLNFGVAMGFQATLYCTLLALPTLVGHSTITLLLKLTGWRTPDYGTAAEWLETLRRVQAADNHSGLSSALLLLTCGAAPLCVGHCVLWSLLLTALALLYARSMCRAVNGSNTWTGVLRILASDLPYMLLGAFKIGLQLLLNFLCLPVSFAALTAKLVLPYLQPTLRPVETAALIVALMLHVQGAITAVFVSNAAQVMLLRPEYQLQLQHPIAFNDGAVSSLGTVLRDSLLYLIILAQFMLAVVVGPLLLGRYLCPLPLPPDPCVSGSGLVLHLNPSVVLLGGWVLHWWDLAYLMLLETFLPVTHIMQFSQALLVMFEQCCLRLVGLGHLAINTAVDTGRGCPPDTPQVALTVGERWRYLLVNKVRLLATAVVSAWLHRAPLVTGRWACYLFGRYLGLKHESVSDLFLFPLGLLLTWQFARLVYLVGFVASPRIGEGQNWRCWLHAQLLYRGLGAGIFLADLTAQVLWVLVPGWLTGLLLHRLSELFCCLLDMHSKTDAPILYPAQLLLTGSAAWTTLNW
jgi:hypothetical protein